MNSSTEAGAPFADRLAAAVIRSRTPVMVGLDPRVESLPPELSGRGDIAEAYREFCCGVIDAVHQRAAVIKPQMAFFEEIGPGGMETLVQVITYAVNKDFIVVLDGKRNDIGTTAEAYARAYLGKGSRYQADALTVSPYLGDDSLSPFVDRAVAVGAGVFVLVKTSNPGGKTFQDLLVDGLPMYRRVAALVQELAHRSTGSCGYGAVGAVVGATYPQQLAELRSAMPNAWLLVPGYGAQGAGAKDVAAAFDERGLGAVINSSRGIIFAHQRREYQRFTNWQDAVAAAADDMIAELRTETPAGKL